jgi:hypothetical protein
MKGTELFVLLQTSVVIIEEYNVMANIEELIFATEYLSVCTTCHVTGFDCISNYNSKKTRVMEFFLFLINSRWNTSLDLPIDNCKDFFFNFVQWTNKCTIN